MSTTAIIQARMSSSRLPGKVIADIGGNPMLWHVVKRAQSATRIDRVVVATSTHAEDAAIEALCARMEVPCYRGSLHDVLDRYHGAAAAFGGDCIIRLTADCPLLDPVVIDRVVDVFHEGYDYVSNAIQCTFPDGLDTEAFSSQALTIAWKEAVLTSEREHVTPFIRNHPERFRIQNVANDRDLSSWRWTVDEASDLNFVRAVFTHMGRSMFGMTELVEMLDVMPALRELNAGIRRNEGYEKSLKND